MPMPSNDVRLVTVGCSWRVETYNFVRSYMRWVAAGSRGIYRNTVSPDFTCNGSWPALRCMQRKIIASYFTRDGSRPALRVIYKYIISSDLTCGGRVLVLCTLFHHFSRSAEAEGPGRGGGRTSFPLILLSRIRFIRL